MLGLYGVAVYGHNYYQFRGFPPPKTPKGIPAGRYVHVKFFSRALGQERSYLIYLPAGYSAAARAGRRFPVYYFLHGSPGWPSLVFNAARLGVAFDELLHQHKIRPFLMVGPDGRNGTFASDTEWANTRHGRYDSYVIDVVHAVDSRWSTIRNRRARLISGNSEGAYAALNLSLRHLTTFGNVESWSGYVHPQAKKPPFAGEPLAVVAANDPSLRLAQVAGTVRRMGLRANLYIGKLDHDAPQVAAYAAQLRAAGARVTFSLVPGGHNWRVWRDHAPAMLEWASRAFQTSRRAELRALGVAGGRLVHAHFYSAALGQQRSYAIYLPPNYDAQAAAGVRFPVFYFLHGSPGWPSLVFSQGKLARADERLLTAHRIRPFIMVMPDGRNGTQRSDTEWANTRGGRYESFVMDLVRAVDARWATLPGRRYRMLAGNSEGAYGALNISLHHLHTFGLVEAWSGYVHPDLFSGPFVAEPQSIVSYNDPSRYLPRVAARLRKLGLHAYIYTGTLDSDAPEAAAYATELRAAGGKVVFRLFPGGHTWKMWRSHAALMLLWASKEFGQ